MNKERRIVAGIGRRKTEPSHSGRAKTSDTTTESILHALRSHVETHGDANLYTFLKSDDERISVTYRTLDERARQIAWSLLNVAEPGDRALMMYPSGLNFIEAFLGCLYAGIVAVPAYPPRIKRNNGRIPAIAEDCSPRLLLCTSETKRDVEDLFCGSAQGSSVFATDEVNTSNKDCLPRIRSETLAYLQYTSGSTAAPRGVMVTHGNIVANEMAIMANFRHTKGDVAVSWLPMFHDMGLIGGVLQPLFVGFPCYLMAPRTFIREPVKWLQAISDFRGVFSGAPNFAYDLCARRVSNSQKAKLDLSSWIAFNGAEPVRANTLKSFSEAFESSGFRREAFFPCYGMAETTLFVSGGPPLGAANVMRVDSADLEQHRIVASNDGQSIVSCGRIGPDLEVRIVDPETLVERAVNEVGEIWIHGKSVANGYWNRAEETIECFRAELQDDNRDWFRTGDYGFLQNGELFVTGRLKDLIIIRGRNLYPQDIEQVVERHLDFVEPNSCAAFSIECDGEEKLVVVAEGTSDMVRWAKTKDEANGELVELNHKIAELRTTIVDAFDVALTDLAFIRPSGFPRTSSGKVQRRLAKRMLIDGEFDVVLESAVRTQDVGEVHLTRYDEMIGLICQAVREWAAEAGKLLPPLDGNTVFASLGIDSVAAISIGARLENKLGLTIGGETLYREKTIHQLSGHLACRLTPNTREAPKGRSALTILDYISSLQDGLRRFRQFKRSGHDYFATEIERQEGSYVWVGGHKMLMMASYSYLGLINRKEVNEASRSLISSYGTGAHGVRLLAGTFDAHRQLETAIAEFFDADDAIIYSSGYLTNLATVAALVSEGDVVIGDELNHASIVDGCEFSKATFLTFPHNNIRKLECLLKRHTGQKILVVVDAVYSMDGDIAPLPPIVDLCQRYGALLMVDEAHSLGVIGQTGRGISEHFNLPADVVDIKMGTLSKAVASCGGFIAARQDIIDYLKYNARGFIFSAALPAAQVGAARKCFEIIREESHLADRLRVLRDHFVTRLRELGFKIPPTESAIVPIIFSSEEKTLEAVSFCRERGLFVAPVFYPAVPMDKPRIRATVMASFSDDEIEDALRVFAELTASL